MLQQFLEANLQTSVTVGVPSAREAVSMVYQLVQPGSVTIHF